MCLMCGHVSSRINDARLDIDGDFKELVARLSDWDVCSYPDKAILYPGFYYDEVSVLLEEISKKFYNGSLLLVYGSTSINVTSPDSGFIEMLRSVLQ